MDFKIKHHQREVEWWLTADWHLDHENIIRHAERPFCNAADMGNAIIAGVNRVVRPEDHIIHVGDLHLGKAHEASYWLHQIRCKNLYLIKGDHDNRLWNGIKQYVSHIKLLPDITTMFYNTGREYDLRIVLCHWPFASWAGKHYGGINLHGHSHGNLRNPEPRQWDVGIDANDFAPVSLTTIIKRFYQNDHSNPHHGLPRAKVDSE